MRIIDALMLVLSWCIPSVSTPSPAMPMQIFAEADRAQPVWVDARKALSGGAPDPAQFDAGGVNVLNSLLELPETNGCIDVGASAICRIQGTHSRVSLDASVDTAHFIVEGVIEAQSAGFFSGVPGTLYRVRLTSVYKGTQERGFYYIFLQVGVIPLGGKKLCKSDSHFPTPPRAGQRLILLTDEFIGLEHEFIDVEEAEDIVLEETNGGHTLAEQLRTTATAGSFDELGSYIRARVASAGAAPTKIR